MAKVCLVREMIRKEERVRTEWQRQYGAQTRTTAWASQEEHAPQDVWVRCIHIVTGTSSFDDSVAGSR
jgi:hypothetical protein